MISERTKAVRREDGPDSSLAKAGPAARPDKPSNSQSKGVRLADVSWPIIAATLNKTVLSTNYTRWTGLF